MQQGCMYIYDATAYASLLAATGRLSYAPRILVYKPAVTRAVFRWRISCKMLSLSEWTNRSSNLVVLYGDQSNTRLLAASRFFVVPRSICRYT